MTNGQRFEIDNDSVSFFLKVKFLSKLLSLQILVNLNYGHHYLLII